MSSSSSSDDDEEDNRLQTIRELMDAHKRIETLLFLVANPNIEFDKLPEQLLGVKVKEVDMVFTSSNGGVYSKHYTWCTRPPHHSNFMFRLGQAHGFARTYMDNLRFIDSADDELTIMLTLKILQLQDKQTNKVTMMDIYHHELIPYLRISNLVAIVTDYLPTDNRMWIESLEDRKKIIRMCQGSYLSESLQTFTMMGRTYRRDVKGDMNELYQLCKSWLEIGTPDMFGIDQDFVDNYLFKSEAISSSPNYNYDVLE
jgi:hypothetical protein